MITIRAVYPYPINPSDKDIYLLRINKLNLFNSYKQSRRTRMLMLNWMEFMMTRAKIQLNAGI